MKGNSKLSAKKDEAKKTGKDSKKGKEIRVKIKREVKPLDKELSDVVEAVQEKESKISLRQKEQDNLAYRKHIEYTKQQQGYAHELYTKERDTGAYIDGHQEVSGELSLEEIDGMIFNSRLKHMNLSHAKEYSHDVEARFKIRNLCNWNHVLNMVKYTLSMN